MSPIDGMSLVIVASVSAVFIPLFVVAGVLSIVANIFAWFPEEV